MFIPLQIVQLSPFLVPVWIAGFLRLWRSPLQLVAADRALAYPILCVIVLATGGKSYYALPLLLILVAAGAQSDPGLASRGRRPYAVRLGRGAVLTAVTSVVFTLPVLPDVGRQRSSSPSTPNRANRSAGPP